MEVQTTCPRAAQYSICSRLRSAGTSSALKFGGVAHRVLEHRYRSEEPLLGQSPDLTARMIKIAEGEFKDYSPPPEDYRTLDRMVDLIVKYGQNYPAEMFDIFKSPTGKPFIEVPFLVPVGEIPVNAEMWVQPMKRLEDGTITKDGPAVFRMVTTIRLVWMGRIDLVYRMSGGIYIMDHKTSSMATNMAEFEISHQFLGYVNAVQDIIKTQVDGIVINRMVCRKPTRTGEAFTFERKLIPVSQFLVSEWKVDVLHIVADFIEMVRRQYLPKHTSWCVGKFGTCQFHKVCTLSGFDQRDIILHSGEYEENTWSPLKDQ